MKRILTLLIILPILIFVLQSFSSKGNDYDFHVNQRDLICSSCHSVLIDDIIVGKTYDSLFLNIEVTIPNSNIYSAVELDIIDNEKPLIINEGFTPLFQNEFNTIYNLPLNNDRKGKKENTILIKYPLESISDNKELKIQGVITNGDGTIDGDYSFFKTISLEDNINKAVQKINVFPTVARNEINIDNAENSVISIYALNGKLVYKNNIINNKDIVDVSNFENGFYFMRIQNENSLKEVKILIKK